jgi:hypothetical protein
MGSIRFRIAVHGRDPEPAGDGDIEGAFIKAGFSRLDAAAFSDAVVESHHGLELKASSLKKAGIDTAVLASCLHAAGLIVEIEQDDPAYFRPAGRNKKGQPGG